MYVGGKSHVSNGQDVSFKEPCQRKRICVPGGPQGPWPRPDVLTSRRPGGGRGGGCAAGVGRRLTTGHLRLRPLPGSGPAVGWAWGGPRPTSSLFVGAVDPPVKKNPAVKHKLSYWLKGNMRGIQKVKV